MRNKDSPEKKESSEGTIGTSLSLEPELKARLKQKAKENGLSVTAYIRNWVMGKPEYAADVEAWIAARSKKIGVCRRTVVERVLLFAMMTERRNGKDVV